MQINLTMSAQQSVLGKKDDKNTNNALNSSAQDAQNTSSTSEESIEQLKSLGGKGITQAYMASFMQQSFSLTFSNSGAQGALEFLNSGASDIAKATQILSNVDFAAIGYEGKSPLSMNGDELNALIGENGFFGLENTASRIADFVIQGAGEDLDKLKSGFEGMKQGFAEAEKLWGGKLPQLSQDTIDKAIEKVSTRIDELGGKAVSLEA